MPDRTHETAFGPVNAKALEDLEQSFETQRLLEAIDQLDRLAAWPTIATLRGDMFQLHDMAHTVINGATRTLATGNRRIWELAGSLTMELEEIVEELDATRRVQQRLSTAASLDS